MATPMREPEEERWGDQVTGLQCRHCRHTNFPLCRWCEKPLIRPVSRNKVIFRGGQHNQQVEQDHGEQPAEQNHRERPVEQGVNDNNEQVSERGLHVENLNIFKVDVVVRSDISDHNDGREVSSASSPDQGESSSSRETAQQDDDEITARAAVASQHVHVAQCQNMTMEASSTTIYLNPEQAQLQHITDSNLKRAVENALVAKVVWRGEEDVKYRQKYEKEKRKGEVYSEWFKGQIVKLEEEVREGKRQLAKAQLKREKDVKNITEQLSQLTVFESRRVESEAAEIVARLTEDFRRKQNEKERELEAMTRHYQQEKAKEEEKVMTFVLRLEQRDQTVVRNMAAELEGKQLTEVLNRLYTDLDIRLLGVDCGLSFLMKASVSRWASVVEKDVEKIQATLAGLLPADVREVASWQVRQLPPLDDDVDIELGQPLPVQVETYTQMETRWKRLQTDQGKEAQEVFLHTGFPHLETQSDTMPPVHSETPQMTSSDTQGRLLQRLQNTNERSSGETGDWKNWFRVAQSEQLDEFYVRKMADTKIFSRYAKGTS